MYWEWLFTGFSQVAESEQVKDIYGQGQRWCALATVSVKKKEHPGHKSRGYLIWCAWQESNLRTRLRRPALYPLSYRRVFNWQGYYSIITKSVIIARVFINQIIALL